MAIGKNDSEVSIEHSRSNADSPRSNSPRDRRGSSRGKKIGQGNQMQMNTYNLRFSLGVGQ